MALNQYEARKLSHFELLARQVVEGYITGMHKSPFHGFSVEFAEHRLYNTGESTRHIDWKLYGRSDKLFVKRYEEETNLRCQLVIDNSSSMYFPALKGEDDINKIRFSALAAASIMYIMQQQRDGVGLSLFSDHVEFHTPARSSMAHHKMLWHNLEKLFEARLEEQQRKSSVVEALHEIAENVHRCSLVVIFSDMMDSAGNSEELFGALQHLRHNKHDVVLFHVQDKKLEEDFNFENRPYQLIDMETGERLKLHPNEIRNSYQEAYQKHKQELMLRCSQYKIDFVEADIHEGYHKVLESYLIKRQSRN